ncbi:hypothetical protein, partial [Arthrobacter sp. HMSC08H08]|uniref:hypothetical protein n=1 Tax=Arthrobacter sp. HMSC08H08 TaxID=1581143 RepID=UPI001C405E7C
THDQMISYIDAHKDQIGTWPSAEFLNKQIVGSSPRAATAKALAEWKPRRALMTRRDQADLGLG